MPDILNDLHHPDLHNDIQPLATPGTSTINENAIVTRFVASRRNYLLIKRTLDILFSFLLTVLVLSWLLPLIAIWIKSDSRGPVFFSQKRMGRNGRIFRCFKLRTMIQNDEADERQAEEDDDRITKAGKFLRKTNLDELPQLLNVLIGDMSFIGPRPHMLSDCARFSFVISSYNFRTLVKPGITGLAQINGYRGPAKDYESIVRRFNLDTIYIRKSGFWLDCKIFAKTILRVVYNLATVFSKSFQKNQARIHQR